jgi:3-methyladenine DNA glycosylase/8-oxoguanine DNA glycosylase
MIQKAVEHLKSVDPVLQRLMEKIGPVSVKARRVAVFQYLVQVIMAP